MWSWPPTFIHCNDIIQQKGKKNKKYPDLNRFHRPYFCSCLYECNRCEWSIFSMCVIHLHDVFCWNGEWKWVNWDWQSVVWITARAHLNAYESIPFRPEEERRRKVLGRERRNIFTHSGSGCRSRCMAFRRNDPIDFCLSTDTINQKCCHCNLNQPAILHIREQQLNRMLIEIRSG